MIALIVSLSVIGGIFLIFAIVLACPVIVDIQFKDSFVVKIKILGIPITVFPQKEKPQSEEQKVKKKKKKKPEEEKEKTCKFSKIKGILESKGLSGLLDFFKELAGVAAGTGKKLFSHLVIYQLLVDIAISNEDAAKTAIQYGQACAVVYPAMSMITTVAKCKQSHVCVIADFDDKKTKADFRLKAGMRPIFVLTAGISGLIRLIKVYRRHTADLPKTTSKGA